MLWASGSVALALWFALGWLATAIVVHRARPAPVSWQVEINGLCERLRVAREVRVRMVAGDSSPIVAGLWRTVILMPDAANRWNADQRHSVLLHELAHVRRGDLFAQALGQAAAIAYWFNPLVWIALSHLRSERERACDDEVLRSGAQPSRYARHLLDIARELRPTLGPSAALAMARPSELEGRLIAVLATGRARVPARATRWAIAATVAIVTTMALGATPSAQHVRAQTNAAVAHQAKPRAFGVVAQAEGTFDERRAAQHAVEHAWAVLKSSPDAQVRQQAVSDLSASGEAATLRPLEAALADPDQDVREKAALGLALMSSPDAIPGLLRALGDPDPQVREKAAIGLVLRRDSRVVEALVAAMDDTDSQVREKAAIALGTSGDARATAVLERAMQDPDAQVREKAVTGLLLLRSSALGPAQGDTARDGLRGLIGAILSVAK